MATLLTLRDLNRATLARQMLLERSALTVPAMVEHLGGLQAQLPISPYIGLWTRLNNFTRADLAQLIENREIVKATLMRGTLHLVTAADYLKFRATLQPVLTQGWAAITKDKGKGLDIKALVAAAREFISEQPRTFAEITAMVTELMPDRDAGTLRYAVRTHLPLVQVPIETGWSYPGNPRFALADAWLNRQIPDEEHLKTLIKRYLAAFGPATVADMQTWSGLSKLKEVIEDFRAELVTYRTEKKQELFDLPDQPLPAADTPAPVRFLPEYDNLLLSHKNRTRVIADEYRSKVYLPGLRVRSTFLIDGFVRGGWKIEKSKKTAVLIIEPFAPLTAADSEALAVEGENLLRFAEADAEHYEIQLKNNLS